MSKGPIMRDGDIEALRNKRKDEGRPLKSSTIRSGGQTQHYKTTKSGRVRTTQVQQH